MAAQKLIKESCKQLEVVVLVVAYTSEPSEGQINNKFNKNSPRVTMAAAEEEGFCQCASAAITLRYCIYM